MMDTIGNNLSNASFIPTRLYRNARKHGDRYHRGMHDVLLAAGILPIVTQTMTTMMKRTIVIMTTTTADTIAERAIAMNHDEVNGTNPPRHRDLPLCTNNNRNLLILPTLRNTIQNGGSMTRIFVYKSDAACLNHSRFLGLDLEHPKLKSGFAIDNSRASIILTRILQRSLA
jgi:hypothetical protein